MQAQAVWPADASRPAQQFTFQTPCVVRLDLQTSTTKKRPDGSYPTMIQLHFCVPVSPTRFRVNTIFLYAHHRTRARHTTHALATLTTAHARPLTPHTHDRT
jgi:hypothetical protein